jgi:hypothetical protein
LIFPTTGGGQGINHSPELTYGTFAVGDVCISEPGSVRIIRVEPVNAEGGATFTDFSVYSFNEMVEYRLNTHDRLRTVAHFSGGNQVTYECGPDLPIQSLALELHKPNPRKSAVAREFRIVYESGGETRTLQVPWRTSICNGDPCA